MPEHLYKQPAVPKNRYLAIFSFVVLSLSLIELTEVVNLPFESSVGSILLRSILSTESVIAFVSGFGYLGLFLLMVLESASLPVPSELVLPFAGYLAYLGSMNLWSAVLVATAAGLAGAMIDYLLALKLGRRFVDGILARLGVKPNTLEAAEAWMNRKGSWSVLLARFVPGLRSIISVPAGLLAMKVKHFAAMTVAGSFAWSAILIYTGYSAGRLWSATMSSASLLSENVILLTVAVVSIAYIIYFAFTIER